MDFDILGLNTVDPPLKRDSGYRSGEGHDADLATMREDEFCQRLLLLGA